MKSSFWLKNTVFRRENAMKTSKSRFYTFLQFSPKVKKHVILALKNDPKNDQKTHQNMSFLCQNHHFSRF